MGAIDHIVGELIQRRTLTSKHYLLADGTYQALLYKYPVHFEDEDGNLHNIDHTLLDEADFDTVQYPVYHEKAQEFREITKQIRGLKANGTIDRVKTMWHPLRVPHNTKISKHFKRGYEIGKGADRLKFTPVGASASAGYLSPDEPNKVEYQDVWNDTDVLLEVHDLGIKETITLKSPNAPTKFSFKVEGSDLADDFTSGGLTIRPAWLEDANGTRRDVTQSIRRETDATYIDLVADVTDLTFPVVIDPTTTITPDATAGKDAYTDTYNASYKSTNFGTSTVLQAGANAGGSSYWRTYIQFDLSSIPAGASISSTLLYMYLTTYVNNTGTPDTASNWLVSNVTATWDELTLTYNNEPAISSSPQTTYSPGDSTINKYQMTADLTVFAQQWYAGTLQNNGVALGCTYVNEYMYWNSSDATANRPYLTVTYDQPPGAPTVTSPNGGESWNAQQTITWTAASDPDTAQSSLQYNIDYSTDNGQTWNQIVALTGAGATSYTYDFSNVPQSSTCLIRIRAYDGVVYGPYDQSNGVFTIQHNQAPTAPTNLAPAGGASVDLAVVQRLSWKHNDPNNTSGGDPQSKFDLQWSSNNGQTWNMVTQTTPNQYWDAPANTFPHGNIVWQIRTYDQAGVAGPYSSQATFLAGNKPALPTITSPTNNSIVNVSQPTVQWSSNGQTDYQVQVLDATNVVYWDSADMPSTNKATTIQANLANGATYKIKLRIKNADGLWSDYVSVTITVSYTPPVAPDLSISSGSGCLNVRVINKDNLTNNARNSDFEMITGIGQLMSDTLTQATTPAWTVQSGSFSFGASGATATSAGYIVAGTTAWKPLTGSGGQNLTLLAQGTFKTPASLTSGFVNVALMQSPNPMTRYYAEINLASNLFYLAKQPSGGSASTIGTPQTPSIAIAANTTYTITISIDVNGNLVGKLYAGTGTGGTLLATATVTDTSVPVSGGFQIGLYATPNTIISNAFVSGPAPDWWGGLGYSGGQSTQEGWMALTNTSPINGNYSLVMNCVYSSGDGRVVVGPNQSATAGNTYTASVYAKGTTAGGGKGLIRIIFLDSTGSTVQGTPQYTYFTPSNTTQRYSVTATAPANTGMIQVSIGVECFASGDSGTVTFDEVQLEQSATANAYVRNDSTSGPATSPTAAYNDVYRRESGTTNWTRIATNIPDSGTYSDYAVASSKSYDYYVRTFGTNGTFVDSVVQTDSVILSGIWLHDVSDPSGTALNLMLNDSRAGSWKADAAFMQFAGRSRKVAEFGDFDDYSFKFKVSLDKNLSLGSALQALCYGKGTLCARDYRGRKVFGVITDLPDTDTFFGSDVSLVIQEIDYVEAV